METQTEKSLLLTPIKTGNVDEMVKMSREAKPISKSNDDELKMALKYVFALIGLRGENKPDEAEKMILLSYIRQNLSIFTLEDIRTAFTLYVQKVIDYTDPPYQNFSVLFLENVMQSYRRLQVSVPRVEPLAIEEKTSLTDEQKELIAYKSSLKMFENYKKTGFCYDFGNAVYEYLRTWGLLKQSQEGRDRRMNLARNILLREAKDQVNSVNKQWINSMISKIETDDEMVIAKAKEIRLMDFFDKLIEQGIELKEVLK